METINTPRYYKHLSEERVMLIGKLACEKVGIRATERITGNHRDTVSRVVKDLAGYAEFFEDLEAAGLKAGVEHEVDEAWTFLKKGGTCKARGRRAAASGFIPALDEAVIFCSVSVLADGLRRYAGK